LQIVYAQAKVGINLRHLGHMLKTNLEIVKALEKEWSQQMAEEEFSVAKSTAADI